jgi:hypothetical protein
MVISTGSALHFNCLDWEFKVLMGLEFELRALHLQSKCSITGATPPVCFALVILEMGALELFAQAGLKPQSS